MPRWLRRLAALVAILGAVVVVLRRRSGELGVVSEGGILIGDARLYDRLTGWLLGSFYSGVADDVARVADEGDRILDVGCGPGHLVECLVDRGLEVTGIDLDPAMIERAEARLGSRAELLAADVAALPFPDASFDVVVSTLSMHHWADHRAGLALIYDIGGARVPLHGRVEGPAHHVDGSSLELVEERRWRWPGSISLVRRVEARPRPA
jgi:SAM-dependent methyltransferase